MPHLTDAIIEWIENVAAKPMVNQKGEEALADVCCIELGGVVGDIESMCGV